MDNLLKIPDHIKDNIICYLSGKLSKQQADELLLWLNKSEERKQFFDHLTDIWHTSATLSQSLNFNTDAAWNEVYKQLSQMKSRKKVTTDSKIVRLLTFYKVAAAAAILILCFGIGGMLRYYNKISVNSLNKFVEIVAPRGSKSELTLPDGTKVWLNSGSKLSFKAGLGLTDRDVNINGEAYFVVAKNKKIPFIVHTSDINITALGTAFNVKAYLDEGTIETTLEEGEVKIEPGTKTGNFQISYLKPKQKAIYLKSNTTLTSKSPISIQSKGLKEEITTEKNTIAPKELKIIPIVDTRLYTSWKEERWIFRHELLDELAKKLERRYDITIIFKDEQVKEYSFSGTLQEESIEQVLNVIRIIAPINYKINHKTVELSIDRRLEREYEKLLTPDQITAD